MENNTKKYILYFTLIVVLFLTIVLCQLWSKKKLEMEQKEVAKRFIDMEFSGIVNQYEEIPRGMLLWLDNQFLTFGMSGTPLLQNISLCDSIVKKRGSDQFLLYKKDTNGVIVDKVVVETGYFIRYGHFE